MIRIMSGYGMQSLDTKSRLSGYLVSVNTGRQGLRQSKEGCLRDL